MQLASQLVMLTEVQTSMPIMWQIGPQLDSILATFPFYLLFQDPLLCFGNESSSSFLVP
jgi:hypothetical protein